MFAIKIYIYLFEGIFLEKRIRYMRRTVKLDWDYRILHTSGEKVVKPVKMTDRFIQNELDCIDDLDAFIEDNSVQDLDESEEAALNRQPSSPIRPATPCHDL